MDINSLINDEKTLVVINHSGGKDSQAMYLFLKNLVPADRMVVIHANLPGVEWPGVIEHIEGTTESHHDFHVVQAKKTFFEMVDHRGMFPSPSYRQCTSDLKRGPIAKKIRNLVKKGGFTKVLNCMGLRAQESSARAKKEVFKFSKRNSTKTREWFEWLPIHDWTEEAVFSFIHSAGQTAHWAYSKGMSRLSCVFCIMSSVKDIRTAAKLMPEVAQRYIDKEKEIGHTLLMPKKGQQVFLEDIISQDAKVELMTFTARCAA